MSSKNVDFNSESYETNFSEAGKNLTSGYLASQDVGAASDDFSGKSSDGLRTHQPVHKPDLHLTEPVVNAEQDKVDAGWYGSMIHTLGECIGTIGAVPCCVCFPSAYRRVEQGSVGLVTNFGRYQRMIPAGLIRVNPLSERLYTVDVKIQLLEAPQQVCISRDNVSMQLSSVIYYHIVKPERAAFSVQDVRTALIERTQTTLRHVVGSRVLQDLIERREEVAASIREIIDEVAETWGVKVESILIKDLIFSRELQESLSMAAQAKRIGESKIIAAKAEVSAAQLMRKTADLLSTPAAQSIRQWEAQQAMAKTAGTKVLFIPTYTYQGKQNQNATGSVQGQEVADISGAINTSVLEHM